jgi:hypothetical protein
VESRRRSSFPAVEFPAVRRVKQGCGRRRTGNVTFNSGFAHGIMRNHHLVGVFSRACNSVNARSGTFLLLYQKLLGLSLGLLEDMVRYHSTSSLGSPTFGLQG